MNHETTVLLRRCATQILTDSEGDDVDWFPLVKIAISVFDGWLGRENYHLLTCRDPTERAGRNRKMLSFWMALYDNYDVLNRVGSHDFETPASRSEYESKCVYNADRSSDTFQCVLIPQLSAIYYENWDDTNVLWYANKIQIKPLLGLATDCGLYSIDYAG